MVANMKEIKTHELEFILTIMLLQSFTLISMLERFKKDNIFNKIVSAEPIENDMEQIWKTYENTWKMKWILIIFWIINQFQTRSRKIWTNLMISPKTSRTQSHPVKSRNVSFNNYYLEVSTYSFNSKQCEMEICWS